MLALAPLLVLAPLLMQELIPLALELALALAPLAMELLHALLLLDQVLEHVLEQVLLALLRGLEFAGANSAPNRLDRLLLALLLRGLEFAGANLALNRMDRVLDPLLVLEQVLLALIPLLALALDLAPLLVLVQVPVPLQALALALALAHLLEALLALHWEVSPSQVEKTMFADQRSSPSLLRDEHVDDCIGVSEPGHVSKRVSLIIN